MSSFLRYTHLLLHRVVLTETTARSPTTLPSTRQPPSLLPSLSLTPASIRRSRTVLVSPRPPLPQLKVSTRERPSLFWAVPPQSASQVRSPYCPPRAFFLVETGILMLCSYCRTSHSTCQNLRLQPHHHNRLGIQYGLSQVPGRDARS